MLHLCCVDTLKSWIIAVLKQKRNRKIWCFLCKNEFYFTHGRQKWYFHSWLHHSWKYWVWCSFDKTEFDLALKKSNILYFTKFSSYLHVCIPLNQPKDEIPVLVGMSIAKCGCWSIVYFHALHKPHIIGLFTFSEGEGIHHIMPPV